MNIETCQRVIRLRHTRLTNMCCCTSSASHLLVPGALQRRGVLLSIARTRTCWIRGMSLHCRSHSTTMHSSSIMKRRSCSVSYHEASCWAIIAIFIFKNPHLVSILVVCMHFKKFVVEIIRLHFCLSVNNFQPLIPEKKARFVASRLT